MTRLSYVIVSYNTKDLLRECLASIYEDLEARDFEILVVDNGSEDGSPEMVSREFPEIILQRNRENFGFALANNHGIRLSSGRFVMLLNSDTRLVPGCSSGLLSRMSSRSALGICGPAIMNPDGSRQPSWGNYPSPLIEFGFQSFLYKVIPVPFPYGRRVHPMLRHAYSRFRIVDWVTAAAVIIRREVFDAIGLLPQESFMYNEDVEFCFRARKAGFEIGYEPGVEVFHQASAAKASFQTWIENYSRGSLTYFASHYPSEAVARVAWIMMMGNLLRYYLWRVIGAIDSSRRDEATDRCQGYWGIYEAMKEYRKQGVLALPMKNEADVE